ncbi:MAG: methyl-accepting chemotaxis protein [Actinomycetota bacterium]
MRYGSREFEKALYDASRRLLVKSSLSVITIPVVVLALFSLTIFGFTAHQYLVFVYALVAVVIPLIAVFAIAYLARQRRLVRRLDSWYVTERDPHSQSDRGLAVGLQRTLYRSSYEHAAINSAAIFLSITLGVLAFGGMADFTPYMSVAYISLGVVLAVTDFFVTLFISQREMRPVLRIFLADCGGFGFYSAPGTVWKLGAFSLLILVLALGITWIASSYISSDMLKEDLEERGRDNVRLLSIELDTLLDEGAPREDLQGISSELALSDDERLAVYDERGREVFSFSRGTVGDDTWEELTASMAGTEDAVFSGFEQVGNREYLVTAAPLELNEGWVLLRVDLTQIPFHALWSLTPTMLLLLLLGACVAIYLTLLLSHNIADPIKRLVKTSRVVATGNLAVEVPVDSLDDFGELSSSYSEMLSSLRHISGELRQTSGEVSEGADSIVAVSEQIMAAIEELNALVQDLSGQIEHEVEQIKNVEEIMGSVAETISMSHAKASQSYEIGQDAERLVMEGREYAHDAVEKISEFKDILEESMEAVISLGESSQKIGTIVDIITRIADQTNLLALNAAIEAARVPEFGKGFAVVADEVKKLAQEAAGSAQRIHELVRAIQDDVETAKGLMEKGTMGMFVGMETVERTDTSLLSISDVVNRMARMVGSIAEASSRELDESERLADSLNAMKDQVEATAQAYEEIGASSEEQTAVTTELTGTAERLSEIANKLQEMVANFKIS